MEQRSSSLPQCQSQSDPTLQDSSERSARAARGRPSRYMNFRMERCCCGMGLGRRMSDANGIQDALHDGSCDVLQDLGGLGGRRRNGNWWLWVASNRQPNELIKSHFTNSELSMYRYAYRHVPSLVSGTIRVHPLFLAVSISTSMHRCVLRLPQQPWATYIGSYRTRRPLVHRGIDTGTCA